MRIQRNPANQCPEEAEVSAGVTAAWILPPASPILSRGRHGVPLSFFLASAPTAGYIHTNWYV